MNDSDNDIFGDVVDTVVSNKRDPMKQLYLLPDGTDEKKGPVVSWFLAKDVLGKPKEVSDCTAAVYVRFLSWQIGADNQAAYMGSGKSEPGTLRNQLIVRYHAVPDSYDAGIKFSARTPCKAQFGETCPWCTEKVKADKRFTRNTQPANYFKEVIAPFLPKDKTFMLANIYTQDADGLWVTDGKIVAFEFSNYVRNGRTFTQILNDRANDADNRIRIDKKTYAGYVNPVVIKITYSWPTKNNKVDNGQFSTWTPTDATPFPVEAGGPDVSKFTKEWAIEIAHHDPASWINRDAWANIDAADVSKKLYGLFTGEISPEEDIDLDIADFGQLLAIIEQNKEKFEGVLDVTAFDYSMEELLREIVKGVLNG